MIERQIDLDTAPFDVGMEWPEELWVWMYPNGTCGGLKKSQCGGLKVQAVSISPKGLLAYYLPGFGTRTTSGNLVETGFPEKRIKSGSTYWDAVALLDDNGIEIDRRALK